MMTFSEEQIDQLSAPLSREAVKTREQGNKDLSFIESWWAIAEANRIFGFDGWSSETLELNCVCERERTVGQQQKPGWGVSYTARVRVTAGSIVRDGCGAGHDVNVDVGLAHEKALKEAESDARKRALMTFGNPFGLALYDKTQANVVDQFEADRLRYINYCEIKVDELAADPHKLLVWWNSANEHKARDDYLTPADRIRLKNLVSSKLPERTV